ncbi:radical SAM protein [Sediminibacter sp. Hel_I_10]|uniref:radical SAM protein n=1 Tax=Sediminibacter sp. Hel_I_10 TaxID=1392490 RepID=UPI0018CBF894|nr:radical SAM protein [Sediminibacter sp. Hel_I_10]
MIDTDLLSKNLRIKGIDIERKSVSITNFYNSEQEKDIKDKPNCEGFGRVRHFKYYRNEHWPDNPLPILPASRALGINANKEIRAQVFQNSVCNWRCWYCFVDFKLLSGSPKYSNFKTCDELLDLYLKEENPSKVIDLTGGQPDLTPEWIPWMMNSLIERGLDNDIYLWSDDNLSNDYFWRFLTNKNIDLIKNYKMYGRVCCFKGIDDNSFSLNTQASPALFNNQLELAKRLIELKIDLYFYITLTASSKTNFNKVIPYFMDKLQSIHENLPLKIVPLEVFEFTPVISRMNDQNRDLIKGQYDAIKVWTKELNKRYDINLLEKPITEISL